MKEHSEVPLRHILLTLQQWGRYLLRQWKRILLFGALGAVIGLGYALLKKPQYIASVSFVTDNNKRNASGMGMYSGVAAQLGINFGSMGFGNQLFSGENIFDLMKTRLILQKTLLTPVVYDGKQILLIDRYIEMEEMKDDYPALADTRFKSDRLADSSFQVGIIKKICKDIRDHITTTTEGSILTATFASRDEWFSKTFLDTLMGNVQQYYVATQTKKARTNLNVLERQLDSVRGQLYGAMGNVAGFQDVNRNLIQHGPQVTQQKNSLKVNINSAIYQQLVTALESAKMTLQQETPLFEIIDQPLFPLDKDQPGTLKWGIGGALLGVILSAGLMLMALLYREILEDNK